MDQPGDSRPWWKRGRVPVGDYVVSIPLVLFWAGSAVWLIIESGLDGVLYAGALGVIALVVVSPTLVREYSFYIALIGWAATYLVLDSSGATAEKPFYEAAAQVIPILFLAAVVGDRFSIVGVQEPDRRLTVILLYALVLGEGYCLDALASDSPADSAFAFVVAALVLLAIVLLAEVIGKDAGGDSADDSGERNKSPGA